MKELAVPIDQAGRVVLPKQVRQELGIEAGDTLKVLVHGSSVTLTPNKERDGLVRKGRALVFSTTGEGTLNQEAVDRILEEGRGERHEQSIIGLRRPRREE